MKHHIKFPDLGTGTIARMLAFIFFISILTACNKKDGGMTDPTALSVQNQNKLLKLAPVRVLGGVVQQNLVADVSDLRAQRTDFNLVNAWGIAFAPNDNIWIASNHKGLSVVYNLQGIPVRPPVNIPLADDHISSSPDGVVYNSSSEFGIVYKDKPVVRSEFIFSTEDGVIAAWASGNNTVIMVDNSATGAVYKGIAIADNGGQSYLYATNFSKGTVDVFDGNFKPVNIAFADPGIPAGFAPFNIRNIEGDLYVTYAMQKPDHHDDQAGPGNGYVDQFKPDGSLVRRFASQGTLNSPWGITETVSLGGDEHILVGNFGDGKINAFDAKGNFLGQLGDNGVPIIIDGLWGLSFMQPDYKSAIKLDEGLFFTAGPSAENHGLFGMLRKK